MAGIMGSGSFLLLHGVAKLSIAEVFLFFLNMKFEILNYINLKTE
jgi:hypothetical protein